MDGLPDVIMRPLRAALGGPGKGILPPARPGPPALHRLARGRQDSRLLDWHQNSDPSVCSLLTPGSRMLLSGTVRSCTAAYSRPCQQLCRKGARLHSFLPLQGPSASARPICLPVPSSLCRPRRLLATVHSPTGTHPGPETEAPSAA